MRIFGSDFDNIYLHEIVTVTYNVLYSGACIY